MEDWMRVSFLRGTLFVGLTIVSAALVAPVVRGQSAGPNVNMVSGTGWTNGDPFLQRQNEPTIAVSTRNTLHLVAGANDYRGVDVPGLLGSTERGDAWLGLFKSFDGGQTWQSTLLPGYPLDQSKEPSGLSSPIHGFQAAADPTVRPGTNGLFYYSGLAFNRGTNPASTVFVARFIDNNNKENGDPTHTNGSLTNLAPTDPIQYLGTVAVQKGTSSVFLDKPWIATDIPRSNATCQIPFTKSDGTQGTQTIPAGRVFLSYSSFVGSTSSIMFTYSPDCGATWSKPVQLSQSSTLNQGSIVVVAPTYDEDGGNDSDPEDAIVYVAWRRFNASGKSDALMIAKSSNGGESFAKAVAAVSFPSSCGTSPQGIGCAFDQGETGTEFRSNAYPAMTVDDLGRVYLAWSQRQANGDGRIMMQVSTDGLNWTASPALVDNGGVSDDYGNPFGTISGRGHQLMPTLAFIAGKLTMTFYDQRQDHTLGVFTPKADLTGYREVRQLVGELMGSPASSLVFNSFINDAAPPLISQRHTIDIQGAQASSLPAGNLSVPAFTSFRISRYAMGLNPNDAMNSGQVEQLQVSPPNLPMFALGTEPFEGDYIDIAPAPAYVLQNGAWKFNTSPTSLPVFHTTWTDNRDVKPPANGDWTQYVPPYSLSNPSGTVHASLFDPAQNVPACVLNLNDGFTATRDQNIYTSIIAPGLVVGSLGNSKTLGFSPSNPGQLLQRAFAVTARNTTPIQRTFRITVGNQPALANGTTDPAGQGSLLQNSLQTSLDATISSNTSVARAVFVQSANPTASVTINVQEITAPGGTLVSGGLTGSVTLNPDPNAPAIQDPDSFGFANPGISGSEVHNPVIGPATIVTPPVGNSSVLAPAITNPAITNPAITNPAITNPAITNPALLTSLNPAITNPAITNPAITNPAITNPAITNPAITNTSIADASYPLTNTGNTTTSYAVKLFQRAPLPAGVNLQLIVVKQYLTPIANGCNLAQNTQNIVVADVPIPVFTPAAALGDPNLPDPAITNATIALAPGETAQIILRANVGNALDMQNLVLNNITPVAVAHPSNTGVTVPAATLTILTVNLPDGVVGTPYSNQVNIFGGVGTHTASITSGALPAGLNLDSATGIISGTPLSSGSFSFTFQAADSSTPPVVTTQNLSIRIGAPLLVTTPSLADGVVNTLYSLTLNFNGGLGNTTWTVISGSLPSGISLNSAGVLSGTPTILNATGTPVTIQVQDSSSPAQTSTIRGIIHIAPDPTTTSLNAPAVTYPAFGLVTVTASSSVGTPTGNASLVVDGGTPLIAALDGNGVATFMLTNPSAGIHSLSASYAAQGNFAASTPTARTLTVLQAPSIPSSASATFTAAVPGTFTVTSMGFPVPNFAVTAGTLPSGVFFADNLNGTATLEGTATVAGNYPLTITAANNVGSPVQQVFTLGVNPGTFAQLQLLLPGETAAPGTATGKTGTPNLENVNGAFNVTVNAVDANWNLVNTAADAVQFSSNDAQAILPTSAALVAGTGAFSVKLTTPQTPAATTITATDVTNIGITPSSSPAIKVVIVYTANLSPSAAANGASTAYTLTVNDAAASNANSLSSVTVAIPKNGGIPSAISVTATNSGSTPANWLVDSAPAGFLNFRACTQSDACNGAGSNNIGPGGSMTIQFATVANENISNAVVDEVWTTTAFSDTAYANPLPLAGAEPNVGVGGAPSFSGPNNTAFTYAAAGTFTITTTVGVPSPSLTASGSLPSGVTFADNGNGTATLAGTPGAAGSFPLTITAHNGYGADVTRGFTLAVNQAAATVTLGNLTQTYTGSPLSPTVTTTSTGLAYTLTAAPDTNAGSYPVTATITNPNYTGSNNGTFVISKAAANITLGNLVQAYTGSPLSPTVTTIPSGLAYTLTGAPDTTAGSYPVTATINNANYAGSASGTFVITRPAATVSSSSINFGVIRIGTAASQNVVLKNSGSAPMTITSTKIGVSPDSDEFSVTSNCGATLAAGASCTITVTYHADIDDLRGTSGTLVITDSAPGSPQSVALKGQSK
jgi:hypothetical protein